MQPAVVVLVLAALAATACARSIPEPEVQRSWESFKTTYSKTYPTEMDEAFRQKIFKENLIMIAKHNALFEQGVVSFKVGINKYSDMLPAEIAAMRNGFRGH